MKSENRRTIGGLNERSRKADKGDIGMSCQEGSWCDFLLWLICFTFTMGTIAVF